MGNQVASYAQTRQLKIVGYYQAPERLGDTTLSPVGERVACKITEFFEKPVALVVSNKSCRYPLPLPFSRCWSLVSQINDSKLDDESGGALVVRPPDHTRSIPLTFFLSLISLSQLLPSVK